MFYTVRSGKDAASGGSGVEKTSCQHHTAAHESIAPRMKLVLNTECKQAHSGRSMIDGLARNPLVLGKKYKSSN